MGIIRKVVWEPDPNAYGGIRQMLLADPDAYGKCVLLDADDWAELEIDDFYDGTILVNIVTKAAFIKTGPNTLTPIGGSSSGAYLPLTGGVLAGPGNLSVGGTLSVAGVSGFSGNMTIQNPGMIGWKLGTHPQHVGTNYVSMWRQGADAATDYVLLAGAAYTFINTPTGGTLYFRVANADIGNANTSGWNIGVPLHANSTFYAAATIEAGSSVNMAGQSVVYWPAYGGGLQMVDSTWVRTYNNKNFYCSALLGSYQLTVGLGGAITGGYVSDLAGNMYVRAAIRTDGWLQSVRGDAVWWNNAHIQAYCNGNYCSMSFYQTAGGAAPQLRNHASDGYAIASVNSDQSGFANLKAYAFQTMSTATMKHDIRSYHDFVPYPSDVEWDCDVMVADIMALRPVVFRRNDLPQKVIRIDDGAETLPMDQQEWEIIENMNPIAQVEYKREQLGLIAEEVAKVIPSAVQYSWTDGAPGGINYVPVIVALLAHVQKLTLRVDMLEAEVVYSR
jgi:hypothetical protein